MDYRRSRILDISLLTGAFSLALVYSLRRMSDSDLWGHLKCGEFFFSHGAVLKTHYFNCSWPDFPYLNHEWLFQAVVYLVQRISGEPGLMALQIVLVLLSFFLLYKILRLQTDNLAIISFVLALGILASSHRFALRPQHFTYVFLLFFLFSLCQYRRGVLRYARFMPLIMLFWVNMHAESLWGILVPATFLTIEWLRTLGNHGPDRSMLKKITLIFGVTILASLINPFTYKTLLWPLFVMKEQFAGVEELLAPTSVRYGFFWVYFGLFAAIAALNFKQADPAFTALSVFFAAVAWTANRGIPHFVFVSAPVIAASIEVLNSRYGNGRRFTVPSALPTIARLVLLAGIVSIIVAVVSDARYLRKYDNVAYPEGAVAFLKENGINGNVFNEHVWGGYLIWTSFPDLKPYIDGRFFHKKFYDEYYAVLAGQPGWESTLEKYGITIALLAYSEAGGARLNDSLFANPRWRLVYWDDASLVYLRDSAGTRKVIDQFGNGLVNPDRQFLFDYEGKPTEFVMRANAAAERNLRFARRSYKALIMSGNTFFRLGGYRAAVERYEESLRYLEVPNAWIYYRIALCYRNTGDLGKTEEYLKKSLSLAPNFQEGRRLLQELSRARRRN